MMVTMPISWLQVVISIARIHTAVAAFNLAKIFGEPSGQTQEIHLHSMPQPQPQPNAAELGLTPSQMASVFLHNGEINT
jgi:hypothetical protein